MAKAAAKKKNSPSEAVMAYDDNEWQAQSDAETLCKANEIRGNKARLKAALAWASKRCEELGEISSKSIADND